MKRLPIVLFKTFLLFVSFFILWVIGLFAQLPLIPWIETDYHVAGTNQKLANGYILKQTDDVIIKIEVPDEFFESERCFDFWFSSASGTHLLTVKELSQTMFDNDNTEIKRKESYLFWDNGSKEEVFEIDNYRIIQSDNYDQKKYVFFRTVFNDNNESSFSIKFKTNFYIDNKPNYIDTTLQIQKKHRLTWNKFRVH